MSEWVDFRVYTVQALLLQPATHAI